MISVAGALTIFLVLSESRASSVIAQRNAWVSIRTFTVEFLFELRHRFVEIIGNNKLALRDTQEARGALGFDRHEPGYRLTSLGNDNLFAQKDPLQKLGEMSLGIVNVDFYGGIVD
jgi:hypothetical protein